MSVLATLLDKYLFAGVPSNAVYDLIKHTWEKVHKRGWEELYLDAFESTLAEERSRLVKDADGEISWDREVLHRALHQDLGAAVDTMALSELSEKEFASALAQALAEHEALTIGGYSRSHEDYEQLVRNLVKQATAGFNASVIKDQDSFQKAMVREALGNRSLAVQTQNYLNDRFDWLIEEVKVQTGLLEGLDDKTEAILRHLDSQLSAPALPPQEFSPRPDSEQSDDLLGASADVRYILHLSGLHIRDSGEVNLWRTQLAADLRRELDIGKLDYVVIAGDVADTARTSEYEIAADFLSKLLLQFELDASRVIVVPGNHDVNWQLGQSAYGFTYSEDAPVPLPEGHYVEAGEKGVLLRSDDLYRLRFAPFSEYFYGRILGREYPPFYSDQSVLYRCPEEKLLFLGLNSCWELDRHFRTRSSIHMGALARALEQLHDSQYDDWLKIAVWHHPITGPEAMKNTDFLDQLAVNGFHVCMTGHIFEPTRKPYDYDDERRLHIIGAGVFGIPATWARATSPMAYNLIEVDLVARRVTVETRKKEKPDGAWSADARWGPKNNPVPRYTFEL